MKKLLLILILSFFSAQSLAGSCPDGSEPVKSISADGTYFVYNCGGQASSSSATTNSKAGTMPTTSGELYESTKSGDWFSMNESSMWTPHFVKHLLVHSPKYQKSWAAGNFAIGDFDNDGIDDYFQLAPSKLSGMDHTTVGPTCRTNLGECYSEIGPISVFKIEWKGKKYWAKDVSGLIDWGDNIKLIGTSPTDIHLADFNGDGKLDIFATDTANIDAKFLGKNDAYLLSNAEGLGWTESTATHVTGTNVQKGKGLINFSHGSTVGDIDGDGDIDVIVTSIDWAGPETNRNGEIWCYVNQGDGHMKVRRCGKQWGFAPELGDIDNDGDLDLVWGSSTFTYVKDWNKSNEIPGCFPGRTSCNGTFNGILLNDGTGNFYERGFSFPDDVKNSSGQSYTVVPEISVADLDGDGDLDVVRSHVGHNYVGAGMTIEENIGNGKFRTAFYSEFCASPKKKADFPNYEGNEYNCWVGEFKFGDFNKDGFIDIVLDGHDANNSDVVQDGAIYMSTGKFTYDIVLPNDEDFPLIKMKLNPLPRTFGTEKVTKALTSEEQAAEQKAMEDELAAFEAELAAELGQ